MDENTASCIGEFSNQLAHLDSDFDILEVPSGEESKSIEVVVQLWASLLEYGADRQALLINLGGMVCDLGAFVASIINVVCVMFRYLLHFWLWLMHLSVVKQE